MKIWKIYSDEIHYDMVQFDPMPTPDEFQTFDGRSKMREWVPLSVVRMEPEKALPMSDAPGISLLILSKSALDTVRSLIGGDAEILPLVSDKGEFYIINTTTVLNCVDYEKSMYKKFSDGKRIMRFEKYILKEDIIRGHNVFIIPDEIRRRPLVSDAFREAILNADLKGIQFELVWDSEA